MGLPPVVVGLFVTVLLWRSGPLGELGLLYTPTAMVVAQAGHRRRRWSPADHGGALQQVDPRLRGCRCWRSARRRPRALVALLREARLPLLAAVMAGFGAVICEVGAAHDGRRQHQGQTRVLTTAAVLATSRGEFSLAIAFGILLLAIAFAVNLAVTIVQQRQTVRR